MNDWCECRCSCSFFSFKLTIFPSVWNWSVPFPFKWHENSPQIIRQYRKTFVYPNKKENINFELLTIEFPKKNQRRKSFKNFLTKQKLTFKLRPNRKQQQPIWYNFNNLNGYYIEKKQLRCAHNINIWSRRIRKLKRRTWKRRKEGHTRSMYVAFIFLFHNIITEFYCICFVQFLSSLNDLVLLVFKRTDSI